MRLSDEHLAAWQERFSTPHNEFPGDKWEFIAIIRALLAEVDRLREVQRNQPDAPGRE